MAGLTERSLTRAINGLLQRDDSLCTKAIIDEVLPKDVDLARAVSGRDTQLDGMNASANRQLTERMMEDRDQLRGYLNLIIISRCLERVGDHATNIAEDAVYAAAAEDIRHQT